MSDKLIGKLPALAFVVGWVAVSLAAHAEQPVRVGPPAWMFEASQSDDARAAPASGPPAWVIWAWQSGERPVRPSGPPPWIAVRHEMAKELGLPGPPPEVMEAWENGEGPELPGPPDFVLDLLGL